MNIDMNMQHHECFIVTKRFTELVVRNLCTNDIAKQVQVVELGTVDIAKHVLQASASVVLVCIAVTAIGLMLYVLREALR